MLVQNLLVRQKSLIGKIGIDKKLRLRKKDELCEQPRM
jgi:hypothetical protein